MCIPSDSVNFIKMGTVSNSFLCCHNIPNTIVQADSISTWNSLHFNEIKISEDINIPVMIISTHCGSEPFGPQNQNMELN